MSTSLSNLRSMHGIDVVGRFLGNEKYLILLVKIIIDF